MTEEQFKALTTMMHDIAYSAIKTYDLSHSPRVNQSERLEAARQASINSGKAIAKAHALLVEQPAKEIRTFCEHGMLPGNCTAHGCKHWFRKCN